MNMFVAQIATSLLVAIVTSYLSVQLALRRFYQEKWWERRLSAYLEVIDALHTINKLGSTWYDEEALKSNTPDEIRVENGNSFRKARSDLSRAVDLGELMLTEETVLVIAKCQRHLDRINFSELGPYDYYGEMIHAAQEALEQTRDLLKRDLWIGHKPWRPSWRLP